ncbi:MAG: transposase [Halanaerobiales bacterium]|nr:transposase [Halanaerobiales bacterium]
MWTKNSFQQMSFDDTVTNMPNYLKDFLKDSWAHTFQKIIFPAINEDRFAVLYSDKPSRPNSPVNVIIGALILKEIFQLSDVELLGSIYFDDRFQYALRLTSFDKPPVSINTFTNFRTRVYAYEEETGIDLIKQEVESLSELIADKLEIGDEKIRVDSFMVASSSKNMSRIELVYTVNANLIKKLKQMDKKTIPKSCLGYLKKGHKKETIYKTRDKDVESKLEFLLRHSQMLYRTSLKSSSSIKQTEEFKTLKRMLGEQTDNDDFDKLNPGELKIKDGQDLSSDILQNPSDPDATYRYKYGPNIGYTANMVEVFDEDHSIIKDYDFKPNIYSDQKFSKDTIEKLDVNQRLKNPIKMLVDGAYFTLKLAEMALDKGIELIPGQLIGRKEKHFQTKLFRNISN